MLLINRSHVTYYIIEAVLTVIIQMLYYRSRVNYHNTSVMLTIRL